MQKGIVSLETVIEKSSWSEMTTCDLRVEGACQEHAKARQNEQSSTDLGGGGARGDSRSMESTLDGVTCDSELEEFRGSMVWGGKAGRWQIQVRVECWGTRISLSGLRGSCDGGWKGGKKRDRDGWKS